MRQGGEDEAPERDTFGRRAAGFAFCHRQSARQPAGRGRQLDATASGRYTLTEESLKTVAALRQPVTIRLYVSEKLQSAWDELGAHAARTTAFLARCVLAAPDKIRLEIRRIKPFSDMENKR